MIKAITSFFLEFWELTKEMSPYLLLGFLFAGLLHVYFPSEKIKKYLGRRNWSSVLNASLLGIPLPLCSCGVIPTGISFHNSGASKGATVSFLISTPQTGIDSILVTYSLMGLPFAIVRPVIALITGVLGGFVTDLGERKEQVASETPEAAEVNNIAATTKPSGNRFRSMINYAFVEFLNDISKWLVIGLLAAALISVLIPDTFFTDYISNEYLSMLLVLLASIPMYVCATGSVPIAAVLLAKGLSPGAAIVFLMAGPATNAATMMVIGNAMGRKTLIKYLLSIIGGALLFGILVNEIPFLRNYLSGIGTSGHLHVHMLPEWIGTTSAIVLGMLMINGYYQMKTKLRSNKMDHMSKDEVSITVNGMTCSHCKSTVETNICKLEGVDSVTADLDSHEVLIKGNKVDLDEVGVLVQQLGYEYAGKK